MPPITVVGGTGLWRIKPQLLHASLGSDLYHLHSHLLTIENHMATPKSKRQQWGRNAAEGLEEENQNL